MQGLCSLLVVDAGFSFGGLQPQVVSLGRYLCDLQVQLCEAYI